MRKQKSNAKRDMIIVIILTPFIWALVMNADASNLNTSKGHNTMSNELTPIFEPLTAVITQHDTEHHKEDYVDSSYCVEEIQIDSMGELFDVLYDYQVIDQAESIFYTKRSKKHNIYTHFEVSLSRDLTQAESAHLSSELLN